MSRTVLYARVSTAEQTIAHQRTQAEAAGFVIDDVIEDEGVLDLSRFDAAPLIAFTATKETDYGTETNRRI